MIELYSILVFMSVNTTKIILIHLMMKMMMMMIQFKPISRSEDEVKLHSQRRLSPKGNQSIITANIYVLFVDNQILAISVIRELDFKIKVAQSESGINYHKFVWHSVAYTRGQLNLVPQWGKNSELITNQP